VGQTCKQQQQQQEEEEEYVARSHQNDGWHFDSQLGSVQCTSGKPQGNCQTTNNNKKANRQLPGKKKTEKKSLEDRS